MLNQVSMIGYLKTSPVIRHTDSGTLVCYYTVGCDRDYLSDDGDCKTDYYDCVSFGYTGEFVSKYLKKGTAALISGKLRMLRSEDRTGKEQTFPKIIVDQVYLVGWERPEMADDQRAYPDEDFDSAFDEIWDTEKEFLSL